MLAVKVEGSSYIIYSKATKMGIPVVSHFRVLPQSVGVMGYKLQGYKTTAMQLIKDAKWKLLVQ